MLSQSLSKKSQINERRAVFYQQRFQSSHAVSKHYIYIHIMGRKLRNRQILDQTDLENDFTETQYPLATPLSPKTLKKTIHKKFQKQPQRLTSKHNRFISRLENGTITAILDQSKFECPICLQLMVKPTLMNCGHMYCYRCLESNIAHSTSCCLCRQRQNPDNFIGSSIAQNLISEILAPRSNEIFKYLCRTTDTTEWIKRRELNNPRPGLIVDFQDAFKVWRRAIILKTFITNNKLMVNIKSFFKGTELLETIEACSKRLAPLNFFTRSKYLQEFAPVLPEFDLYEKELQILEYRNVETLGEEFPSDGSQQQCLLQFQNQQHQYSNQFNQSLEDQALALFNWQMNVSEFLF